MIIYTMANLPIEAMKVRVRHCFGKLANRKNEYSSTLNPPSIDPYFYKTLQVDGHALLAKTYIKSDEKQLSVAFLLPPHMQTSSPLYISHFFTTSQPGSIQYKLKSEGLIDHITVEHKTMSRDFKEIILELSLTRKGSGSVEVILSYFSGYLEILKRTQPSLEYFQQAGNYFKSLHRLDSSSMVLDRYHCELLVGSDIRDLRDAEVPRVFDKMIFIEHLTA